MEHVRFQKDKMDFLILSSKEMNFCRFRLLPKIMKGLKDIVMVVLMGKIIREILKTS